MSSEEAEIREKYLQLIESEKIIDSRFTKIRRIDANGGKGFFSFVFVAKDLKSNKNVALKFFDPLKISFVDRLERFKREAEMLVTLEDEPLVINCIDGGIRTLNKTVEDKESGITIPIQFQFFAMEKADLSVEAFIDRKNLDAITILTIFKEMIKAVIRIHGKNVCHRDLKPSNFLILNKKTLLSDFGTAKLMNGSMPHISESYEFPLGDRRYIAPEVLFSIGIADEYVFKSDLFSMGAILFEMFTGATLTKQIYNEVIFEKLHYAHQVLSKMKEDKKLEAYKYISKDLSALIKLPEIYSYNDKVPNSIKYHLDELYKQLADISIINRIDKPTSIHRKIDICLKILKNEKKYQKWLEEKRRRKLIRESKKNRKTVQ